MASPITQAVLLIGGLGTRLRPLTYLRPKALLPLLNRPLITYEIELFARHGVTDLIMAISYEGDQIQRTIGDGSQYGVRLHYVNEKERLDTAGAIKNCSHLLDGPFFACNGDIVYDVDLSAMARDHLDHSAAITFCLRRVDDISPYGLIQCDASGRVLHFKEKVAIDETGRNTVNSGFYAMDPSVLDAIPTGRPYSSETDLFPGLKAGGALLYGHMPTGDGYWSDVGRIETYFDTHRSLLAGEIPWVAPNIVANVARAGVNITAPSDIAEDICIASGCALGPGVAIGSGCTIAENCTIINSILWPGAKVGAGAHIERSIIATGASVESGAQCIDQVVTPAHV